MNNIWSINQRDRRENDLVNKISRKKKKCFFSVYEMSQYPFMMGFNVQDLFSLARRHVNMPKTSACKDKGILK